MINNAKLKTVTLNDERWFKTRSEAKFPVKGSRTSPLYSSRLGVKVLNCLPFEMSETTSMNEKCNAINE